MSYKEAMQQFFFYCKVHFVNLVLPEPSIYYGHRDSLQGKRMSFGIHQHLVSHEEAAHHKEYLDYHTSVEEKSFEEVIVRLHKKLPIIVLVLCV